MESRFVRLSMSVICETFAMTLRCERTTPFGSPEEPLVKRMIASSWSPIFGSRQQRAERRGGEQRDGDAPRDDAAFQRREDVVEVEQIRRPGEIREALLHGVRGEAVAHFADAHGGFHGFAAGGEVEIHRHFVREHDGEIRDDAGFPRRQDDGDPLPGTVGAQMAGERDRRREQRAKGDGAVIHPVDHARRELAPLQPAHGGAREVPAQGRAQLITELAEHQKPLAHGGDIRLPGRDRLVVRDGDRIGKTLRHLEEITSALERKDRAPELIEPDRHDRRRRGARDQLIAAMEPQQDAGARELALGKDADDLAGLDARRWQRAAIPSRASARWGARRSA